MRNVEICYERYYVNDDQMYVCILCMYIMYVYMYLSIIYTNILLSVDIFFKLYSLRK